MQRSSSPRSALTTTRGLGLLIFFTGFSSLICPLVNAVTFKSVPAPNLDLSSLGRIALAGSFDSVSLYNFVGQDEDGLSANGSQSLITRFPNGAFTDLQRSDAFIESMCTFVAPDGKLNGVVVGGNFTSIGGQEVQAVALFNPIKNTVTPLPGLNGQVFSVYCDNERQTVYVGGMFSGADSTNAIAWVDGWTNLPFAGFNGPVSSINKLPNGNIIFAGEFTGIGQTTQPHKLDAQIVNVGTAHFTINNATTDPKFGPASNIICAQPSKAGPGTSFVLAENVTGGLQADFRFGFVPSKLRLLNSQVDGFATKTWRFTAFPDSILEFTYFDENGPQTCSNECHLANNGSYQDFFFVDQQFGMDSFRLDISDWYGKGGGLSGFELFQNDIFSYAVPEFNEPPCDHIESGATATSHGEWKLSVPGQSNLSQYLTTELIHGTSKQGGTSVTFLPNIKQSGNYTIRVYTPGCQADDSCEMRGVVNMIGHLGSPTGTASPAFTTQISQTNTFDKYDTIFFGFVEANSDDFRPSVDLQPAEGQDGPLTVVAQRVQFLLMSTTGGLNGLFEFDPNLATVNTNFDTSVIDSAAMDLNEDAKFLALAVDDSATYAAGGFSSDSLQNVLSIANDKLSPLANGGLNDVVQTLWFDDGILYAGGNFTSTGDNKVKDLTNVASYDTSKKTWMPLGAGVNGIVYNLVPLTVNVSNHGTQDALAVSGYFNKINAFGNFEAHTVLDVAIWVLSMNNWLQNLDPTAMAITGQLNAVANVPGMDPIWSGGVDSQMLAASNVISLTDSQGLGLQSLPVSFMAQENFGTSAKRKRATSTESIEGVVTGMFYNKNHLDLTILGGQFTAKATNGDTISNLLFINGKSGDQITGLDSGSSPQGAITALDTEGTSLFAGGSIDGGVLVYDLAHGQLASSQPPALSGNGAVVNAIATRPTTSSVYVGGSFSSAGSLGCPALCFYDMSLQQWIAPGPGLSGSSTINILEWAPGDSLILAGNLKLQGKRTTMAKYDAQKQTFTVVENADTLPGPITAYTPVDSTMTSAFVAGTASSNGSPYLARFDGDNTWTMVKDLGSRSVVEGLQVLSLNADHSDNGLMNSNQVLLITGKLQFSQFGNVSAAIYDGSTFVPFALTTLDDGSPGSISRVFVQNTQNLLTAQESLLALGFIVLIGLACALGAVFLLVVVGIFVERVRRRREGYVPAPTGAVMYEKSDGGKVGKIPAEKLFGGIGPGGGGTAGSRL